MQMKTASVSTVCLHLGLNLNWLVLARAAMLKEAKARQNIISSTALGSA